MKKDDLLDAIGMIDEKYIEEAENYSKADEDSKRNQRNRKKKRFWVPLASAACLCLIIGGAWAMHSGWGISGMDGAKDMSMEAADEAPQQFENEMAKKSEDQSSAGAAQETAEDQSSAGTVQETAESQSSSEEAQEDSTDQLEKKGDNISNEELNEGTNRSDMDSEDQSSIKNVNKESVSSQDDESDEQSDASQDDESDEQSDASQDDESNEQSDASQDDESDEQSDASQDDIDDEKIYSSSENGEKMSIWERIKAFFKGMFR